MIKTLLLIMALFLPTMALGGTKGTSPSVPTGYCSVVVCGENRGLCYTTLVPLRNSHYGAFIRKEPVYDSKGRKVGTQTVRVKKRVACNKK